jgi:hypothetical protein
VIEGREPFCGWGGITRGGFRIDTTEYVFPRSVGILAAAQHPEER